MHDNPQALPGLVFALPDHHVIALSGRDAAAFAQAQFMNDLAPLAPGRWQWSGWLTPKGRVVALFALLKFDDETLWLVLPDAQPTELAAALQRFVFRAKVTIAVRDDLRVLGSFHAPRDARGNAMAGTPTEGIELDFGADGGSRTLFVAPPASPEVPDADGVVRWASFDAEHGLPRLSASQAGQWTPQQLSLERLNAFSVKKGCYPGQEIVARTHFLGKAKRGLALFECEMPVPAGTAVHAGADSLGELVSQVGRRALAVVTLERSMEGAHAGDIALRPLAFLPGLER